MVTTRRHSSGESSRPELEVRASASRKRFATGDEPIHKRRKSNEDDRKSQGRHKHDRTHKSKVAPSTEQPREEPRIDIEVSSTRPGHVRFGSEDVFEADQPVTVHEDAIEEEEEEEDEDEAPEDLTAADAQATSRAAQAQAARAVEKQRADARRQRQEREARLQEQAKLARKGSQPSTKPKKRSKPADLPDLLPADILADEAYERPPTPPAEEPKSQSVTTTKAIKFTDARPKDVQVGPVKVSVLQKQNKLLAPRASGRSRHVKEQWLARSRTSTGHCNLPAMSGTTDETTPLVPAKPAPKPPRTVTFNTNVSTSTAGPSSPRASGAPSMPSQAAGNPLNALNKLRRRHSSGAPLSTAYGPAAPKAGAQRTSKNTQKLKLLPNPDHGDGEPDEESGRDVYSQFTRISDPIARRDAARLGKDDRDILPRVTAYCTADSYNMDHLMKFLRGRGRTKGAQPKLFDECIYTPYNYHQSSGKHAFDVAGPIKTQERERRHSESAVDDSNTEERRDLQHEDIGSNNEQGVSAMVSTEAPTEYEPQQSVDFDTVVHVPEVFLFDYGTVVIWGMTLKEEERFLKEIAKFEVDKLGKDDVQVEKFNFYYTKEYQARIYNDFISLRDKKNYMTKLAISHSLAQSVKTNQNKTSLYEDLVDTTIETTKEIPTQIASTGKIGLSRKEINMQIGELFILRINIHLQGSVLDAPELMWAEPQLDPIYQAMRSYLEMDQRVSLLTERLNVIADLLQVLKDQLTQAHGEYLEWVVIVLIAAEILVAAVNIVVDLYAGVD
ncbi:hypothetical protein FH972_023890 [Carpinus fangiana]|uniref:DUF155 domain-containing protein n=1 Tax=Carpinus fangiana TaxID=176857 RepID=A0A5N6KWQ9_9ROSI|nr:hypothetical protein FH972_023890 [Carpinus fangiana]